MRRNIFWYRLGLPLLLAVGWPVQATETAGIRFVAADGAASLADAACVLDQKTNLVWERKTADGLRAAAHTYIALARRGSTVTAHCDAGDAQACTTSNYVGQVNAAQLCGANDWRLPTEAELQTLLDFSAPQAGRQQAAADMAAFPDMQRSFYWTATSYRAGGVLAVWFDETHQDLPSTSLEPSRAGAVRLVRGARIADAPGRVPSPRLIRLNRAGQPVGTGQQWSCLDEAMRSDSLRQLTIWALGSQPVAAARADSLNAELGRLNSAGFCGAQNWRLPEEAELSAFWQAQRVEQDEAGMSGAREYWVRSKDGGLRVWHPASGHTRIARVGEQPGRILISTTARAQVVRPPAAANQRPAADQLAAWRESYSRYRAGQVLQPDWPTPEIDDSVKQAGFADLGLLPPVPFPADNPYSPAKADLGRKLFFDVRLSRNQQVSCASCHNPATGWTDRREVSLGHIGQRGQRNSMSILNVAYVKELFWDGRAASLEEQATGPIQNPLEMHQPLALAVERISAQPLEYGAMFAGAFGDSKVNIERIAQALATFERTLTSRDSAFDRFLKGDRQALSDDAVWGLHLFRTKARCINCHNGGLFSDNRFHNNGLHYLGRELEDKGRYEVTGKVSDIGKFRTPGLRDVIYTGNYMHNGLFPLTPDMGVIAMYDAGMVQVPPLGINKYNPDYPRTAPEIRPLGLSQEEKKALFALMQAISAEPRTESASPQEMGMTLKAAR